MSAVQQILFAVGTSVSLPSTLAADASSINYNGQSGSATIVLSLTTGGLLTLDYSAFGEVQLPQFPQSLTPPYTWLINGTSSIYSVRMRVTSGGTFNPGSTAINSWVPLTSDRTWTLQAISSLSQTPSSDAVTAVLEIAYRNSLTNPLAQSAVTFTTLAETSGSSGGFGGGGGPLVVPE
jgi:hypothetical protein